MHSINNDWEVTQLNFTHLSLSILLASPNRQPFMLSFQAEKRMVGTIAKEQRKSKSAFKEIQQSENVARVEK